MSFLTGSQVTPPTTVGGISAITGLDSTGQVPQAYQSLWSSALAPILAQAKESSGNLTGTGLSNNLGTAAGQSLSSFLLNYLGMTSGNANRLATSESYQPGLLNYLFQGLGAASPIISSLINSGGGGGTGTGPNWNAPNASVGATQDPSSSIQDIFNIAEIAASSGAL